jgi:hypothetical protein
MAATAPASAESAPVEYDFDSLPGVKLYKLLNTLDARGIKLYSSWDADYPESFHLLNINNFDTPTLLAMFEDLIKDDIFYHNLQGITLSFRIVRGPLGYSPPNILNILSTIKLGSCLGAEGVSFTRNDDMKPEEAGYVWEALPLSVPAAKDMANDIKKGYTEDYPKQPFDEAVMEFKLKSEGGILIKACNPNRLAAAVPAPMQVDPALIAAADAAVADNKPAGGKRPRVEAPVAPAVNITIAPSAARRPVVPAKKGG